jgi:hypothetical protein
MSLRHLLFVIPNVYVCHKTSNLYKASIVWYNNRSNNWPFSFIYIYKKIHLVIIIVYTTNGKVFLHWYPNYNQNTLFFSFLFLSKNNVSFDKHIWNTIMIVDACQWVMTQNNNIHCNICFPRKKKTKQLIMLEMIVFIYPRFYIPLHYCL